MCVCVCVYAYVYGLKRKINRHVQTWNLSDEATSELAGWSRPREADNG